MDKRIHTLIFIYVIYLAIALNDGLLYHGAKNADDDVVWRRRCLDPADLLFRMAAVESEGIV
jgi:hypothetical protein